MIITIYLSLALAQAQVLRDSLALSLDAALARAQARNPTLAAARADARAGAAAALQATPAFLPSVRVEGQGVRTSDPVAVFGLKLRQARFAAADLQLSALNAPAAFTGFSTTATAELPLLAPEALFGYAAAQRAAAGGRAAARRAAGEIRFVVTRAYWDAQLARGRLAALDTALVAARGHAAQAEALYGQGIVSGLDARMARLASAEVEVRRMQAAALAANASAALAVLLALPDDAPLLLTDELATRSAPAPCDTAGSGCDPAGRADLEALVLRAEAATLQVRSAQAANLPQLVAFGALAHHAGDSPWGGGSDDWTLGLGVRWNLFPALAGVGTVRAATAARDAARARLDAARRAAGAEARSARRLHQAARASETVAERAAAEATVALEQARVRYRTGAAPITELLDVQSTATTATLDLLAARRDSRVFAAALELAYGVHDQ